ncbi:hypothetical protein DSO57_1022194 [Entomophthora muscae]|uniref:Uncharacterized protein n=1 Tax=Entomophthora muscae TaxID=34485 RepID=A0ACC2SG50_9FUNG|nr:hypothetical protein DSO57_1022194 [Entomophthora muscae]
MPVAPAEDRQKILNKFRFPLNNEGQPIVEKLKHVRGELLAVKSPGGKILFDFGSNKRSVKRVIAALQIAGGFIENAISFNKTVKVHVGHGDYCGADGTCKQDNYESLGK